MSGSPRPFDYSREELVVMLDDLKFRLTYLQKLDDKALYDLDEMKKLPYEIAETEDKIEKMIVPEGQTQIMTYTEVKAFVEKQERNIKHIIASQSQTKDAEIAYCEKEVTTVLEQRNNVLRLSDISLKEFKDLLKSVVISDLRTPLILF